MKNNSDNCFASSVAHFDDVRMCLITTAVVAAVLCCIVIAILIITRAIKTFINRLIFYLMLSSLVHAITDAFALAPVHVHDDTIAVREGFEDVCATYAYVVQNTIWIIHLFMFWVVLYLFVLAAFKYNANKCRHEIAGIITSIGLPFLFSWIPFVGTKMYGLSGMWCWIKLTQDDCHSDYTLGMSYQFVLFYGPLVVLLLLSYVAFAAIAIVLCKHWRQNNRSSGHHQQALREALPLLIFLLVYHLFCAFMVSNRIYYAIEASKGGGVYFPLWLAHSIAAPAQALFPPVAYLFHPSNLKKLICKHKQDPAPTSFVVPPEFSSEGEPLIIRGTQVEQQDGDYQSLFEAAAIFQEP